MYLIDTHSHLYLKEFNDDIAKVIENALKAGVKKVYLPAISSEETTALLQLEGAYPDTCIAMMGLHPCSVKENVEAELAHVKKWLEQRPFVAIGEIGLDFYWDTTYTSQQYHAFKLQMEWALEEKIPIVIHSRNAMRETIDTLRPFTERGLKGIFHCFSGTLEEANEIIAMGFYLGIGGVVTYKKNGLQEVVAEIPLAHIVLETDAPFLTPVPFRGKRNESAYLKYIAEHIAILHRTSVEEVAVITTENALSIFENKPKTIH